MAADGLINAAHQRQCLEIKIIFHVGDERQLKVVALQDLHCLGENQEGEFLSGLPSVRSVDRMTIHLIY